MFSKVKLSDYIILYLGVTLLTNLIANFLRLTPWQMTGNALVSISLFFAHIGKGSKINMLNSIITFLNPVYGLFLSMFYTKSKKVEKSYDSLFNVINHPIVLTLIKPFLRYNLEYVTQSTVNNGCHLSFSDEHLDSVLSKVSEDLSLDANMVLWGLTASIVLVVSILSFNFALMMIAFFFFVLFKPRESGSDQWTNIAQTEKFHGRNGIYIIYKEFLGRISRVGVAYVNEGVVQSRYHVTGSADLWYDNIKYPPTHQNKLSDMISWGGPITLITPDDQQKVVVEILPNESTSTIVYETVARKLPSGEVVFKGIKTVGGTSGSPYFIITKTTVDGIAYDTYHYAGAVGRNLTTDYDLLTGEKDSWQLEIMPSLGKSIPMLSTHIEPGAIYQYFAHPGSGKTRNFIPSIVSTGLGFCSHVIIAGPTRVVARELYNALKDCNLDAGVHLGIKGAFNSERTLNARIIITTHPALLTMFHKGDRCITATTGFIVDETHFQNSKTLFLLSALRNRMNTTNYGFLVETTATGFSNKDSSFIIQSDSNYPIVEKKFSGSHDFSRSCQRIISNHPGKRIIIFCPSVSGEDGVNKVAKFLSRDPALRVIPLHRNNYESRAPKILMYLDEPSIIVTTSISECGANFNVDICIDSCKQMRYLRSAPDSNVFRRSMDYINQTQYVQRKGRIGRRSKGIYYYPEHIDLDTLRISITDDEAEAYDLMVYNQQMGYKNYSHLTTTVENVVMTSHQLIKWILVHEDTSLNNPLIFTLLHTNQGVMRSPFACGKKIQSFFSKDGEQVSISTKVNGVRKNELIGVNVWDDRDARRLLNIMARIGKIQGYHETSDDEENVDVLKFTTKDFNIDYVDYVDYKPSVMLNGTMRNLDPIEPSRVQITKNIWGLNTVKMTAEKDDILNPIEDKVEEINLKNTQL